MESIKNIKFLNYKALAEFSISLKDENILIGPNNCGKSTIIGAFRLLDLGFKKARNKKADIIQRIDESYAYGFKLDESDASISLENVSTDYNKRPSSITFTLTNGNKLILYFPSRNECIFTWESIGPSIDRPLKFKNAFPLDIQVVPVLGPFEHEETILTQDTIKKGISSHRSSRHFRNYWYKNDDGWGKYKSLIESTWPGMSINQPELIDGSLRMFCSENRMDREVFWAGFGFQIWCQLLTHISRTNSDSLIVIDEPEIYLHPDVQRQLLGILKDIGCSYLIATHSVEIISEADPSDLVMVDKNTTLARRLRDIHNVQKAIEIIGSTHNITLAQLARNKKMIFTEGQFDARIIRKMARQTGNNEIATGGDLSWFESGGFSSWESIKSFAMMIEKTVDERLSICTIYDRDFFCDAELGKIQDELEKVGVIAIFHRVKEIENYLLVPDYISHACKKYGKIISPDLILDMIDRITAKMKADIQGQYIAKRYEFFRKIGIDMSSISADALKEFEIVWNTIDSRIKIVPGKEVLGRLREELQSVYSCTITDSKIIESINKSNATKEILELMAAVEKFRTLD